MTDTDDGYITAAQVAEYLGVSVDWVYEKAVAGDRDEPGGMPSYKLGGHRRFKRSDLDDWAAESRPKADA